MPELLERWPAAVGPAIARNAWPARIAKDGTVHVNTVVDPRVMGGVKVEIGDELIDGTVIRKLDAAALAAWRKEYAVSEMRRTGLLDRSNSAYGNGE